MKSVIGNINTFEKIQSKQVLSNEEEFPRKGVISANLKSLEKDIEMLSIFRLLKQYFFTEKP